MNAIPKSIAFLIPRSEGLAPKSVSLVGEQSSLFAHHLNLIPGCPVVVLLSICVHFAGRQEAVTPVFVLAHGQKVGK